MNSHTFTATIDIIGVNPFVSVPTDILELLFIQAEKRKGKIPIKGTINNQPYTQTLVRYAGAWRLYINTSMLKNSPKRIGEEITITVEFDSTDRSIAMLLPLQRALEENPEALSVFTSLPPSRQKEIIRYISSLKTEEAIKKNIQRALNFLLGNERFIGRDTP